MGLRENFEKFLLEVKIAQQIYPNFQLICDKNRDRFYFKGFLSDKLSKPYHVVLVIESDFAFYRNPFPIPLVLNEEFPDGTPHVLSVTYEGNRLKIPCCWHSKGPKRDDNVVLHFIAWLHEWLICYEHWKATGENIWK